MKDTSVKRIGYGAMGLEGYYGSAEESTAVNALQRAAELGMMIDTADAYGNGHNEELIGQALGNRAFIATKFGIVFDESGDGGEVPTGWGFSLAIDGRPDYVKTALDASLRRLGVDSIDLWYLHYPDPRIAIEETVGAMADAVAAGKVKRIGLSNVTAEQVQRAHHVHKITAVQYEYSLWRREAEDTLLPTLRERDISLVAWSPLGAGFLSGSVESVPEGDFRTNNPRYSAKNLADNRDRFAPLADIAGELGISPAQLALAWLVHQGDMIYPIPGTRKVARIEENLAALDVHLDAETLERINAIAQPGIAQGATLL